MAILSSLLSSVTDSADVLTILKWILLVCVGCALLGVVLRILCGKRSSVNRAVSSAIGILMIYLLSAVLFTADAQYARFLSPLPFITISDDRIVLFSLKSAAFPALSQELVRMMMLAFLVNLLDTLIPKGRHVLTWYLFRILAVVAGMLGQWLISWIFTTFFPGFLVTYAPIVLLVLVALLLAVSVFKLVIGALLGVTCGPVVGAVYTFFFSNIVGKQLTKAALTTLILTLCVKLLERYSITVIALGSISAGLILPPLLLVLIVWYLLYRFL